MVNLDFWKLFESNEKKSVTSARMYLTTSFISLSLLVSPVSATYRVKNSSKRFSKPRFLKRDQISLSWFKNYLKLSTSHNFINITL